MPWVLAFILVGCSSPSFLNFPLNIQVPAAGHESAKEHISALTDNLNTRCNKVLVNVHEDVQPIQLVWLRQEDYHAGGVSSIEFVTKWTPVYDQVIGAKILVVTDGLPPEESISGHLSDCEVGYLWVHWVGILAGLSEQFTDTSKITYGHPNCPGYIPDIVGELLIELQEIKLITCHI